MQERELERKQDEAIEAYGKKKDALMAERQRREAERADQKETERKRIADALERNFLEWKSKVRCRCRCCSVPETHVNSTCGVGMAGMAVCHRQCATGRCHR